MKINMEIRYWIREPDHDWLCFRCAVKFAQAGHEIKIEIDDFSSEYYMGNIFCAHPEVTKPVV